jgi:hypothetical protein
VSSRQVIRAKLSISGNLLSVYDDGDRPLGIATVRPEDDLEVAARQVIREKPESISRFYDPISYRGARLPQTTCANCTFRRSSAALATSQEGHPPIGHYGA